MHFQRFSVAKATALGLTLLLAGCGGSKAPKDPCTKFEKTYKSEDMRFLERKIEKVIARKKKKISKDLDGKVKFGKLTKKCYAPPKPKPEPKSVDPNAPEKKKKKKRKDRKPVNAICEIVLEYCEKP